MLNDERSVEYHEFVLGVITVLEEKKRRVQETIKRIDRQRLLYPEQAELFTEERASTERDLAKLEHHLIIVAGAASS
jgi:hypothetical protein